MQMNKGVFRLLSLTALILVMAGCDSGSSSGSDNEDGNDYDVPEATLSIDDLVGTWKYHKIENQSDEVLTRNYTMTISKTDDTSASYAELAVEHSIDTDNEEDTWYSAREGRIVLNANGTLEMWVDRGRESKAPLTDTDIWEVLDDTGETSQAVIIDSVLYFYAFKRDGTGEGLKGTWIHSSTTHDSGSMEVNRDTLEITDETISMKWEYSMDGITYGLDEQDGPSPYTLSDNTITSDLFDGPGTIPYILSGNWLVISGKNVTSTTSFGWVKQ